MKNTGLIWAAAAVIIGFGIVYLVNSGGTSKIKPVAVIVPELSAAAQVGRTKFEANCMRCHGKNAAGSGKGPPIIHTIYRPSHHADLSFYLAVKNGVQAHHWPFGNMPPVAGVKEEEVKQIIQYIRELQRANGIH